MFIAAAKSGSSSYILLIYVVVIGAFWYFYLRPRNLKRKALVADQRKVDVGDRCQTIGGLIGTVMSRSDDHVTVRTDNGLELNFVPTAVVRRNEPSLVDSSDDEPGSAAHEEGDSH